MNKRKIPINTSGGGTARTLKTTYYKISTANLVYHLTDGMAATGVFEILEHEAESNYSPQL